MIQKKLRKLTKIDLSSTPSSLQHYSKEKWGKDLGNKQTMGADFSPQGPNMETGVINGRMTLEEMKRKQKERGYVLTPCLEL